MRKASLVDRHTLGGPQSLAGDGADPAIHIPVHTIGNAGNQATIDALAVLQAEKLRFGHRLTLEHYGISTPSRRGR